MKLVDRVAIVTGSTQGIGRAIAINLAKEGCKLVIHGRDMERASAVVSEVASLGCECVAAKADVSNSEEVNEMVTQVLRRFGRIDILVNNVGGSARERAAPFHESVEEVWDLVIGRNLKATLICTRAVIGHMIEKKDGRIVNIASVAGIIGMPNFADYSAAKAGIIVFTKALAKEMATYGVRVNSVSPGMIDTRGPSQLPPKMKADILKTQGRLGKPQEVAEMVTFLVSDDAKYVTGHNFVVSGEAWGF